MGRWIARLWWIAVGAVVGLVAAGMQAAEQQGGSAVAASRAQAVQVTLVDLAIRPASIAVPAGQATTLQVRNAGQVAHTFAVAAPDRTIQTPQLAAGESAALPLPALPAGSYGAWCTVAGHKEAGMTATLVAGEAGAGQAATTAHGGHASAMEMVEGHKASMAAFPARTAGRGGKVLAPRLVHGVKVFELVAKQVRWEVAPGEFKEAYSFNGTVPGPELRVYQGDKVRVVLDNQLPEATTVHFHGVTVGNADDGVPYVTQPPVMPGERFAYEFTVRDAPGTFMYHSHFNSAEQVGRGLFGGFVVEPPKRDWDVEYTEFISDGQLGYALNGKGWPATAPLVAKPGQRVLLRLLNAGELLHPFHLHGYHFDVLAEDGAPRRSPERADTIVVAPGQRFDLLFRADHPGVWAFHCHVLSHVEGPNGMFGMATAVVVK